MCRRFALRIRAASATLSGCPVRSARYQSYSAGLITLVVGYGPLRKKLQNKTTPFSQFYDSPTPLNSSFVLAGVFDVR